MFDLNLFHPLIRSVMPELILIVSSLILLIIGCKKPKFTDVAVRLLIIAIIIACCFQLSMAQHHAGSNYLRFFVNNEFTSFVKILLMISTALFFLLYLGGADSKLLNIEFPILIIFALIGMMIMVQANDFISLYLGLELQSLSLYVLAAYDRDNPRSNESGLKYFILGALSSGILLYGISLIYGFCGTTNFSMLSQIVISLNSNLGVLIGLVMIIIAFAFKLSAAPFHMWSPDVYEGAPTVVTAFFAIVTKVAATIVLTKFLIYPFISWAIKWQQIIIVMSMLSMIVGAVGALRQTNIKRLLAYSSIGHVGYMLMGIASTNENGIRSILLYLIIYLITNIGIFACILSIRNHNDAIENINDYAGLSKSKPFTSFIMACLMLSLAGIPPLAGFFGKFYLLLSAVEANLNSLVITAIISTVISAYYYLKIVKIMYFDEVKQKCEHHKNIELLILAIIALLFTLFFMVFTESLVAACQTAAKTLL